MRTLMISMSLIAVLGLGATAAAITRPKGLTEAEVQSSKPHGKIHPATVAKLRSCAKTWDNQKARVGGRDAFMAACVSKG